MAPSNPHIVSQFRQLVYYHLDCNLLRNALFFASRLHAYEPRSAETAYLLALCHLKLGQLKAAYDCSRNAGSRGTHLGCSYVFAQACLGLERYLDGANALERSKSLWSIRNSWGKHTETRRQHLPDAAAVYCLQGKLWQAHADYQSAIGCYSEALKINPLMWDAFTALCDLGANVQTPNIFKLTPEMKSLLTDASHDATPFGIFDESPPDALPSSKVGTNMQNQPLSSNDPFSISKNRVNGDLNKNIQGSALIEKLSNTNSTATSVPVPDLTVEDTPTMNGSNEDHDILLGRATAHEPPLAPARKVRGLPGIGLDLSGDGPPKMKTSAALRSKSRSNLHSDDQEEVGPKPSSMSQGTELKRTVSGKTIHSAATASKSSLTASADPGAPQRKSVRLQNLLRPQSGKFSHSSSSASMKEEREMRKVKAPSSKARSANSFNVGRVVSGNRKHDPMEIDSREQRPQASSTATSQAVALKAVPATAVNERGRDLEALQWVLELFNKLGSGYFALSHYQCQDAIKIFQSIQSSQRDTSWVLAQIGRGYYEQAAYVEAEKVYLRIRSLAPSRLEDMEYYSTSLWHLKHDVDLAYLAHELVESNRLSPQAWCAVGNSFSLQREHDQALKCFKRATQLDPTFAYAYTLQGHEYISNEEYDKALTAYRASITAESRHYNAWYGLGRVFEKQGRYQVAEQHYRTAQSINPTNAVLVTCIGYMLEKQRNLKAALVKYSEACELSARGTLWRFRKAKVLVSLGHPERALVELKVLKDIAPDEANVHFSLANVYKKLRQKGDAIRHFTMALNLDPKASQHIKEAMEDLDNESDDDVDM